MPKRRRPTLDYGVSQRVAFVALVLGIAGSIKTLLPERVTALDPYLGIWCLAGTILSIVAPRVLKRPMLRLVQVTPLPIWLFAIGMACSGLAVTAASLLRDGPAPPPKQHTVAPAPADQKKVDEEEASRIVTARTRLRSVADQRPGAVTGEVFSSVQRCVAGRRISLVPAATRPGEASAARIVHARTGPRGRWSTRAASPHVRYDVSIEPATKHAGGRRVRCTAAPRAVTLLAAAPSDPARSEVVAVRQEVPYETADATEVVAPVATPAPPTSPPSDGGSEGGTSGDWGDGDYTKPVN